MPLWPIFSFDEISTHSYFSEEIVQMESLCQRATMQTERSESSSCKKSFVFVKGIIASVFLVTCIYRIHTYILLNVLYISTSQFSQTFSNFINNFKSFWKELLLTFIFSRCLPLTSFSIFVHRHNTYKFSHSDIYLHILVYMKLQPNCAINFCTHQSVS